MYGKICVSVYYVQMHNMWYMKPSWSGWLSYKKLLDQLRSIHCFIQISFKVNSKLLNTAKQMEFAIKIIITAQVHYVRLCSATQQLMKLFHSRHAHAHTMHVEIYGFIWTNLPWSYRRTQKFNNLINDWEVTKHIMYKSRS